MSGADLTPSKVAPRAVFGRRVREARQRRGWSQKELADQLTAIGRKTDRSVVTRIENGTRRADASISDILAFAAALGVTPLDLLVPLENESVIEVVEGGGMLLPAPLMRAWLRGELPYGNVTLASLLLERPEDEAIALIRHELARRLGSELDAALVLPDARAREILDVIRRASQPREEKNHG